MKSFDLKPYLDYPIYESLKDEAQCCSAKVQSGIIVWDDEIDIDPDRLYLEARHLNS